MAADGSKQKNLTNNPASDFDAAVSPDGKKIAFTSNRDGLLNPEIYVMNADGSNQQRLTKDEAADTLPAWSPDGSKIAFTSSRDGNQEIYTMDAATGDTLENMTKNPARDAAPDWAPDGVTISFETNRDGNGEIYMMDSHGNLPYNLSRNPAVGDFGATYAPNPVDHWNRAFTRAVSTQDGSFNYEIYEMTYLGVTQTNLTKSAATETDPSYSPDGTKIAFTTDRDGNSNEEIYVMNRDGSSPKNLTNNAAGDYDPDWG
jgi:Tol biopolymer transport system component